MHLGLIGGIGPAATEFYYRGLVKAHAATGRPLELTITQADVNELARNFTSDAKRIQAEIFARFIRRLAAAGAETAAVTSIAGHFCLSELEPISVLPIVSAIPAIDETIRRRNLRKVGILGTRVVMASKLYGGIRSADVVAPSGAAFDQAHECYVAMAKAGAVTDDQRRALHEIGRELYREHGAEAILLAGTDLFLAFEPGIDVGYPVLDCAAVHIEKLSQL